MKVSVIIPAKNEELTIYSIVKSVFATVPDAEVLVVDDGSTDSTADLAKQAGARVVSHPYSKGNGAAIKSGVRESQGRFLVFMDADGQHDPADMLMLLSSLESGYDMAIGRRSASAQANVWRRVANALYNGLASYMSGQKVQDLTSGFRCARSEKFKEFLYLLPNGFSYPTTSTMAFFRAGYSICYLPINVKKRDGKSHINLVSDGVRFLLIIFKIGTLYSPLKLFAPMAFAFFALGSAWYGYTFFTMDRFTNMSALLYTGSIMVFLMGLISEQITALMYRGVD
jgi:glycosyltransferase involved in cell wall biosynthesis